MSIRRLSLRAFALCVAACASVAIAGAQEWESTVSKLQPGPFPEPRPVTVQYGFGWNGINAAAAELRFWKSGSRLNFEAIGGSTGLAETLWNYDVKHTASSDAQTLLPLHVQEFETERNRKMTTEITFTPEGATSQREERKGDEVKAKTRRFDFPNLLSLNSALLLVRTQALANGAEHRFVVYPSTSAYLCKVSVVGRERLAVPTGTYNAIKLDLQLNKIGKKRELKPHKKFRKATIWISDDPDRLVLRIEAQVFIGTVYAELQSAQFENGRP